MCSNAELRKFVVLYQFYSIISPRGIQRYSNNVPRMAVRIRLLLIRDNSRLTLENPRCHAHNMLRDVAMQILINVS